MTIATTTRETLLTIFQLICLNLRVESRAITFLFIVTVSISTVGELSIAITGSANNLVSLLVRSGVSGRTASTILGRDSSREIGTAATLILDASRRSARRRMKSPGPQQVKQDLCRSTDSRTEPVVREPRPRWSGWATSLPAGSPRPARRSRPLRGPRC